MANVRKQYTDELNENFGYFATWEPGTIREIGEVGILDDNEFIRETNLENLGIKFKVKKDKVKHELSYSSQGSVSVTQKLAGSTNAKASALAQADAGFIVEFAKGKSVLLKAVGVTTEQIDDQVALAQELLRLYKLKKWNKKWVVITELKIADSATIIISNTSNSKIELSAKADIGALNMNIANADLGLSVAFSSGINTEIIAKQHVTPLFRLKTVKTSFFSDDDVETAGIGTDSIEPEVESSFKKAFLNLFDDVSYKKSKK